MSDLTDPLAVARALDEFDRIGRDAFLLRYGFGPARAYFVEHDAKRYDSKAIAGAAYGYQYPNLGPLHPSEFSGGEQHVKRKLEALGYHVVRIDGVATSNPDWHRDEAILVLDLYINELDRRLPSNKSDERILAMSDTLQRLPIHPAQSRADNFRNPDGIYLKLANFRAIDPSTDRRGATHGARVDRQVWDEFAHDPQRLRAEAQEILDRYELGKTRVAPEIAEAEQLIDALASGRRHYGQGFLASPEVRHKVEEEAMERAKAHYRRLGWQVEDVSRRECYDLHCRKPDGLELRVEVKGTTGDGSTILLTGNEVEHARQHHPHCELFVVSELRMADTGDGPQPNGGVEEVIAAWRPDDDRLRSLSYAYRLRP